MMRWHVVMLLLLACLGCGKPRLALPAYLQSALRDSPTFELYSIDPEWHEPETPRDSNLPRVHGYIVLGSTKITDAAMRRKLTTEMERAAAAADGSAACHDPRHMIRLQHQGQTIDLLICFQCLNARAWINDERQQLFSITGGPQATFNQALTDAGLELAP